MTSTDLEANAQSADHFADDLDCVISDPLKFKRKLRIGEDAYATLRLKQGVQSLWDVSGVAMTGATLAASKIVAGTLFASSAGLFSAIGIGAAAATPVGWVVAAAVATGGAYYGVTRLVRTRIGDMVDTIPRFINTPIDLLGMQLLDLIGALAVRVASIDGTIASTERSVIERHFVDEWGYDPEYTARALDVLIASADENRVKSIAKALADFQTASPDCNAEAMQSELLTFLREVVQADGVLDEREELAVDAIVAVFKRENAITLSKVGKSLSDLGGQAGSAIDEFKKRMARPQAAPKPA
jgi:hypothetical protein